MKYKSANEENDKLRRLLDRDPQKAREFYLEVFSDYYLKYNEMMRFYMRKKKDWEYAEYLENLNHELNSYGGTVINSIDNYAYYIKEKSDLAGAQHRAILDFFYKFMIGVQSMEILYEFVYLGREIIT